MKQLSTFEVRKAKHNLMFSDLHLFYIYIKQSNFV